MRNIEIFDTTLRDGEQAPGNNMNPDQKLKIAFALEKLGVDIIEAGFPVSNDEDFKACQLVSSSVKNSKVCGLARCVEEDILTVCEALQNAQSPVIHVFYATSPLHLERKYSVSKEEALKKVSTNIRLAKKYFSEVIFSAEDGSRTSVGDLIDFFRVAYGAGATILDIADTVGIWKPNQAHEVVSRIVAEFPDVKIGVHTHNDRGLATINTLEAVIAGATHVQGTINGIGERAGNCSIAEVCLNLLLDNCYSFNLDPKKIRSVSDLVYSLLKIGIPYEGAVV